MGKIQFFQQDANLLGTPSTTQAYLGYHTDGSLFFKTNSGTTSYITTDKTPSGGSTPITISLSEANDMILANAVVSGQNYLITGVDDGLYGGTTIFVVGLTQGQFSSNGWGQFYNPLYDSYSTWDSESTYNVNDTVIYGGKAWVSLNGAVSTANDIFNLNADDWSVQSYTNSNYYQEVWDKIEYDFTHDIIISRHEANGNNFVSSGYVASHWFFCSVRSIAAFRWGDPYNGDYGVAGCNVVDSYLNILNMINSYVYGISLRNFSQIFDNPIIKNSGLYSIDMTNQSIINSVSMWNSSIDNIVLSNTYLGSCYLTSSSISNLHSCDGDIYNLQIINGGFYDTVLNDSYVADYFMYNSSVSDVELKNSGTWNVVMDYSNIRGTKISQSSFSQMSLWGSNWSDMLIDSSWLSNNNLTSSTIEWGKIFDSNYNNMTSHQSNQYNLEISGFSLGNSSFLTSSTISAAVYNNNKIKYQFGLGNNNYDFNGTSGYGSIGTLNIASMIIPDGFYIEKVLIDSIGLTYSAGSSPSFVPIINLGISGTNTQSGLDDINGLVDNINNSIICYDISNGRVTGVKSVGWNYLVGEVKDADITGGNIQFEVILKKTNNSYYND